MIKFETIEDVLNVIEEAGYVIVSKKYALEAAKELQMISDDQRDPDLRDDLQDLSHRIYHGSNRHNIETNIMRVYESINP